MKILVHRLRSSNPVVSYMTVPHVIFRFRGTDVQAYPAFLFLGVTFGVLAGTAAGAARGLDATRLYAAILILTIPALIGSRLLYVATHLRVYKEHPSRIWARGDGGAMLYGGFLLALASSWPVLRILGLPFWSFWDAGMVALLVGMAFTKVGCLLNGCCAGRCTTGPLALELPDDRGVWCARFPSQLVEGGVAACLLGIASIWHNRPFEGAFFFFALIGYAAARLPLAAMRERSDKIGGINVSHGISIALIISSIAAIAALR